jgi:hypothetical protein
VSFSTQTISRSKGDLSKRFVPVFLRSADWWQIGFPGNIDKKSLRWKIKEHLHSLKIKISSAQNKAQEFQTSGEMLLRLTIRH